MYGKLIIACTAVAAFASFVLPAGALAVNEPQLTEGASLIPTGSTIVGTAANTLFTNTEGTETGVTCSTAKVAGTVKANSSNKVEWEIPKGSAIFSGTGAVHADNGLPECTGGIGNSFITVITALCVRSDTTMSNDEFLVNGGACGTGGKVKYIIGSTTAGECEYETTGAVRGTYTTNGTQAFLTTVDTSSGSGSTKIRGGFLCPSSGALAMTFGLETTNGTAVSMS